MNGLVVDPIANKLYTTSADINKIEVINVDGTGLTTLIITTGIPLSLVIDVTNR